MSSLSDSTDSTNSEICDREADILCEICYDELPRVDFIRTCTAQHHLFCRFCVGLAATSRLGSSEDATCPASDCEALLSMQVLREAGGEQLVSRDRTMRETREQRRDPLSRWCPKCNEHTRKEPGKSKKAECTSSKTSCGFEFCSECLGPHHPWRPCLSLGRPTGLGLWTLTHDAKSCPQCHTLIHKVSAAY